MTRNGPDTAYLRYVHTTAARVPTPSGDRNMTQSVLGKPDENVVLYQLPQPQFMAPDMVQPGALSDWLEDDELWVPKTATYSFKPLLFNVNQGYYVNLTRVRGAGIVSRHRHPGAVHGLVLKGHWYYLEHDWIAEQG